jgi:hypothetical protein
MGAMRRAKGVVVESRKTVLEGGELREKIEASNGKRGQRSRGEVRASPATHDQKDGNTRMIESPFEGLATRDSVLYVRGTLGHDGHEREKMEEGGRGRTPAAQHNTTPANNTVVGEDGETGGKKLKSQPRKPSGWTAASFPGTVDGRRF